jgi:tape measure domain-containing protein
MATIRNVVQLQDGMSPVILSMNNALNIVISSFEQMQRASGNSVDTASIQAARRELSSAEASFNQVEASIRDSNTQQQQFNNSIREGQSSASGLLGKLKSFIGVYAGIQGIKMMVGASDEMTQTTARLNMMNDGLQTTYELQEMIYQSAQRSRVSYTATANAVAQLGIRAKDAFSSNAEVVAFSETLNKMFTIAGAGQAEISSATLQLTQALGSGVLRGEEFNAVFEAAPNVMQALADYMGKPIGELRTMASEGQISADIVKQALFAAADETNAKFASMPMTWAQVWVETLNTIVNASQPVLTAINWIANNLDIIGPIVLGIAVAAGVYMVAAYGAVAATWLWAQAQAAFNAVMALNPVVLVIMAIVLLIAIFYAAVAAVNKFAGTSISATGIIAGTFMALGATIYNIIAFIWNNVAAFVEFFANVFTNPVEAVKRLHINLALAIIDGMLGATRGCDAFATNMANAIIGGINNVLDVWNYFVDILASAGIAEKLGLGKAEHWSYTTSITSDLDNAKANLESYLSTTPDNYIKIDRMESKDIGAAYNSGYAWGDNASNMFSLSDVTSAAADAVNYDDLLKNVDDTAANTDAIKDNLDITSEDLKYLRDIADRDTINRFTTADIKVEMTNHNSVNSELDLDGIINSLGQGLSEGINSVREGATYEL